jgi:uncharacterized membrane protein
MSGQPGGDYPRPLPNGDDTPNQGWSNILGQIVAWVVIATAAAIVALLAVLIAVFLTAAIHNLWETL